MINITAIGIDINNFETLDITSSVVIMSNNQGHEICLVGVPHFGTQRYWRDIDAQLNQYQSVVCENLDEFPRLMISYMIIAKLTNTLYQQDWFKKNPLKNSIIADITYKEMDKILSGSDIDFINVQLFDMYNDKRNREEYISFICSAYNNHKNNGADAAVIARFPILATAAMNQKNDCVLLVGEAHIKHIKPYLLKRKYRITYESELYPLR